MVSCAVPYCKSTSRKGSEFKRRFYEFPSNAEIRSKWIKNISRKAENGKGLWQPGPSGRDSVCELHFKEDDFRTGLKVRRLKPDAVPTIFPDYPSYKQVTKRCRPPPKKRALQADKMQVKRRKSHLSTNDSFNVEQQIDTSDCNEIKLKDASSESVTTDANQINSKFPPSLAKFESLNSASKDGTIANDETTHTNDTNEKSTESTVQTECIRDHTSGTDGKETTFKKKKARNLADKKTKAKNKILQSMTPYSFLDEFGASGSVLRVLNKGKRKRPAKKTSKSNTIMVGKALNVCSSQENSKHFSLPVTSTIAVTTKEPQRHAGVQPQDKGIRDNNTSESETLHTSNANQKNLKKSVKQARDSSCNGVSKTDVEKKGRKPAKVRQSNCKKSSPVSGHKTRKASKSKSNVTTAASGKTDVSTVVQPTNSDNNTQQKSMSSVEGIPLSIKSKISDLIKKNGATTDGQVLNLGSTTEGNSKKTFLLIHHKMPGAFDKNSVTMDGNETKVSDICGEHKPNEPVVPSDSNSDVSGKVTPNQNITLEHYRNILLLIKHKIYGASNTVEISKKQTEQSGDIVERNSENIPASINYKTPVITSVSTIGDRSVGKNYIDQRNSEKALQVKSEVLDTVANSGITTNSETLIMPNTIQDGEKVLLNNSSRGNSENTLQIKNEICNTMTEGDGATNMETLIVPNAFEDEKKAVNNSNQESLQSASLPRQLRERNVDRETVVVDNCSEKNAIVIKKQSKSDAVSDNNIATDSKQTTNAIFSNKANSEATIVIKQEVDETDCHSNIVGTEQQIVSNVIADMRHQSTDLNTVDQENAQSEPLLIIPEVCIAAKKDNVITSGQMTTASNIKQENNRSALAYTSLEGQAGPLSRKQLERRPHISRLKRKILNLKQKLQLKDNMLNDQLTQNILSIKTKSQEGDKSALFLLELLNNFGKERRQWSDVTLRSCLIWRRYHVMGYEYARQNGLLHLPSKSTLKKFLRSATGEGKSSSEQNNIVQSENNSSVAEKAIELPKDPRQKGQIFT